MHADAEAMRGSVANEAAAPRAWSEGLPAVNLIPAFPSGQITAVDGLEARGLLVVKTGLEQGVACLASCNVLALTKSTLQDDLQE